MSPKIRLPAYFQNLTKETSLNIDGKTLFECLGKLCASYPQMEELIFDTSSSASVGSQKLSSSINIYINNQDVASYFEAGVKDIPLNPADVIDITFPTPGG